MPDPYNGQVDLAGSNEYCYPGDVPEEDGLTMYGGGDHPGPSRPDTSKPQDDAQLGSRRGPGWDFTTANLPR